MALLLEVLCFQQTDMNYLVSRELILSSSWQLSIIKAILLGETKEIDIYQYIISRKLSGSTRFKKCKFRKLYPPKLSALHVGVCVIDNSHDNKHIFKSGSRTIPINFL